jgi:hypothetical protein
MDFESNANVSQINESLDIEDSIDRLVDNISDSGNQLESKELKIEEMQTVLSQISIFNKLSHGLIDIKLNNNLSIRRTECHQYVLLIETDNNLIDININSNYWKLNLQIRSSESDDNQNYSLIQCESIELNRFLSSETVVITLELSEFEYKSLPLLIDVSLVFKIPLNLIKYIYETNNLSEIQTIFDIQLTQWTLNEFHFLSFIPNADQCFDLKELIRKELNSMNRLEEEGYESVNENERKLYRNGIFFMIETIKETINIEPNDNICLQMIKYLIPKKIPVDCIAINNSGASVEAFYFGHNIKLIATLLEAQPNFVNISIEAKNLSVITTIRKCLIQLLNVSFLQFDLLINK